MAGLTIGAYASDWKYYETTGALRDMVQNHVTE